MKLWFHSLQAEFLERTVVRSESLSFLLNYTIGWGLIEE